VRQSQRRLSWPVWPDSHGTRPRSTGQHRDQDPITGEKARTPVGETTRFDETDSVDDRRHVAFCQSATLIVCSDPPVRDPTCIEFIMTDGTVNNPAQWEKHRNAHCGDETHNHAFRPAEAAFTRVEQGRRRQCPHDGPGRCGVRSSQCPRVSSDPRECTVGMDLGGTDDREAICRARFLRRAFIGRDHLRNGCGPAEC